MTTAAVDRVVVGVGSPDRGDDAAGLEVASLVAARGLPGVRVLTHEDPTDLVHAWAGAGLAVVIDAVVSGQPPGTVVVTEDVGRTGIPSDLRAGTHAFGVGEAVALSAALGRLPGRVVLVGIEAGSFAHGAALTPAVSLSLADAARQVTDLLTVTGGEG